MKKQLLSIATLAAAATLCAQTPAFPGAEGHGRFTTGGRGGNVVHVTNLNDSGAGSLREAVKGSTRKIVVFDVSGYIDLKSDLQIGANTTIAGQTAPGQGITLRYYTVQPKGDNIVIRFIRMRRSQVKDVNDGADAAWTRNYKNIILDHCSLSWSIDEVASFYDNRDFTMQWCTISEALANPGHSKGAHSYGGIWGGKNASFHHNFIAHVQNRAPRFNGARYGWTGYNSSKYTSTVDAERVDFRNCLMYNWGDGGCYGGPGGGYINMVNNYYKAGPGTKNKTRVTEVSVCSSGNGDANHSELYGLCSRYYISGNYMAASSKPENYDWNGVTYDSGLLQLDGERYMKDPNKIYGPNVDYFVNNGTNYVRVRLDEPVDAGEVTTHAPEDVLAKVTSYAGASLYRDAVDARNMEETLTGTTTYTGAIVNRAGILDVINDPDGTENPATASFPALVSETRPAGWDTDGDGMPDAWETANGLNPNDASDGKKFTIDADKKYYTNVEVYINSIVEDIMKGGNAGAISSVDEYYPSIAGSAIDDIAAPSCDIDRIEYYDLNGIRLAEPVDGGISIRRIVYTDGTVSTDKVIKR